MNAQRTTRRLLAAAGLSITTAAIAGSELPVGPPEVSVDFPIGIACLEFPLRLEIWPGSPNERALKDKNGFVGRVMYAGVGAAFRMTNLYSAKSLAVRSRGARALYETNPADNAQKVTLNGHMIAIWFPTDLPSGPWTRLISGTMVYSFSPETGVGTLGTIRGNQTDVCAALAE